MTREPEPFRQQPPELYRRLIEEVHDYAIFLTDLAGRVVSWNGGAERLLGWMEAEILGQSSFCVFVPEDVASGAAAQELEKAATEGRAENERWHLRKDGSRFWGSGIVTAMHDDAGAVVGFGKIMRDRTAQRQLEAQLRASAPGQRGAPQRNVPPGEEPAPGHLQPLEPAVPDPAGWRGPPRLPRLSGPHPLHGAHS